MKSKYLISIILVLIMNILCLGQSKNKNIYRKFSENYSGETLRCADIRKCILRDRYYFETKQMIMSLGKNLDDESLNKMLFFNQGAFFKAIRNSSQGVRFRGQPKLQYDIPNSLEISNLESNLEQYRSEVLFKLDLLLIKD
ncbi:hypothetical protein HIO71_07330 [Chryseobacterium aquaticum]|uniref:Uncharacterized protein n=1 Tax=Chryseobacterium aquaticum TaxID=452084 RepID=A0A848N6A7_9FLAO|nr:MULTISPECIES: hypothetical protein [Chryseobacterium]NMR34021.1 hypothetical protein [Chryseobacterium aquaticum]NRQ46096.1 hypothetical protein [Chryseobacterium sp. C-204]